MYIFVEGMAHEGFEIISVHTEKQDAIKAASMFMREKDAYYAKWKMEISKWVLVEPTATEMYWINNHSDFVKVFTFEVQGAAR